MTQFNLLPDVKLEYIRARRMKRTVVGLGLLASGVALAVFVVLFIVVNVVQRQHISNLNQDIENGVAELQAIPDIDKVLTVQNQLNALTPLHEQKPAAARVMSYFTQLTPADASIASINADFTQGTMTVSGSASTLATVNKFVDTLKFTTYTKGDDQTSQNAFSEVVLASFGVSDQDTSYELTFKFNPEIFNNTLDVKLTVPDIISTRSQTEKPTDLFQELDEEEQ